MLSYDKKSDIDNIYTKIKELSDVINNCKDGHLKNVLKQDLNNYKNKAKKYENKKKKKKSDNNYITTYSNNKNSL